MLCWSNSLMGHIPMMEICNCVVREMGELFPCDSDESDVDYDLSVTLDLLIY